MKLFYCTQTNGLWLFKNVIYQTFVNKSFICNICMYKQHLVLNNLPGYAIKPNNQSTYLLWYIKSLKICCGSLGTFQTFLGQGAPMGTNFVGFSWRSQFHLFLRRIKPSWLSQNVPGALKDEWTCPLLKNNFKTFLEVDANFYQEWSSIVGVHIFWNINFYISA